MNKTLFEPNLMDNNKYKLILESINEIVWEVNLTTHKLEVIGGYNNFSEYIDTEITSLIDYADKIIIPEDKERAKNEFNEFLVGNSIFLNVQYRIKTKYDQIKWLLISGKRVKIENSSENILIGTVTDISERKKAEEQMFFMAYHDQLTNLPNRVSFVREMQKIIEESDDTSNKCAVIFIDIDDFGSVNESFGHRYGDVLLKIVSELIKFCIKDYGMVARIGEDNFLVLIPNIINHAHLKYIIRTLNESFENPFEVLDVQTYVTVSMGVTIFNGKDSDIEQIMKNVDIALREAKLQGKNNFIFYDDKLGCDIERKKKIENGLQNALENEEFEIYYQPQVDMDFNKIRGLEALLRWKSKEFGNVPPSEFIPIAEESGLIYKIGEWILKKACLQAKEWKEKGYSFETISINISPKQMKNRYFLELITKVLNDSKLDPKCLEIEITEGTLIKSIEEKSKLLQELVNQNIKVSIDDFGTGYSSLNYLTALPISTLKIDKSFIDKICDDNKSRSIIECIIELSKKLNYNIVAEGVENLEQKELLKKMGCTYIQGYYYSKPLPAFMIEDIFNDKGASYA